MHIFAWISKKISIAVVLLFIAALIFGLTRSFPFWWGSDVPLGYDAWLYKLMREAYIGMGQHRDFSTLPNRITTMFEPLLWLAGAAVAQLNWAWDGAEYTVPNRVFTWWRVAVSAVMPASMYFTARRMGWKMMWAIAVLLYVISFAQRYVYRRWYWKQLLGIALVVVIMWLRMMKQNRCRFAAIPLCTAVFLVNRPAGILLLLISWIRGVVQLLISSKDRRKSSAAVWIGLLIALPVMRPFIDKQIVHLVQVFLNAIDVPNRNDTYQTSGSFMTTKQYLAAWRWSLAGWLTWMYLLIKKYKISKDIYLLLPVIGTSVLLVWVFWQLFFFQRMIGYLDVFLVLLTVYLITDLWINIANSNFANNKKYTKAVTLTGGIVILFGAVITTYARIESMREPIISNWEFNLVQTIDQQLPEDAVIIVPSRRYSPRVWGRSQHTVVAPSLFDANIRSKADRRRIWLNSTWDTICNEILIAYAKLKKPLYIWMWTKEPSLNLTWRCLNLHFVDKASGIRIYKINW